MDGLQTGFKELKAGYMKSVTWPEHHDFGALGPKEGTEGLKKGFEGLETGSEGLETGYNGVKTGSDGLQTGSLGVVNVASYFD